MAATAKRLARAAKVEALLSEGLTLKQVAQRMKLSAVYVRELHDDPQGEKVAERRRRYSGICKVCKKPTTGSMGKDNAPEMCKSCFNALRSTEEYREEHQYWTKKRIIEAIQWWNEKYGTPPSATDWNPHRLRETFGGAQRAEFSQRLIEEKRVPWFSTVFDYFGSWNNAIRAAGLKPRRQGAPAAGTKRVFVNGEPRRPA